MSIRCHPETSYRIKIYNSSHSPSSVKFPLGAEAHWYLEELSPEPLRRAGSKHCKGWTVMDALILSRFLLRKIPIQE